jgi:Tfp pilus assembly protein PilF
MIELMLQAEQTLGLGLVDQAERMYRQAAAADPHNAIAIIGLARVQLERDDRPGAHQLTLRALAIDPENATAVRMEARLREVLAGEGIGVNPPPASRLAPLAGVPTRRGALSRLLGRKR